MFSNSPARFTPAPSLILAPFLAKKELTLPLMAVLAVLSWFSGPVFAEQADLHDRLIIIDPHVDIPKNWATHEMDPSAESRWQVDLPKMRAGGMDAAFFVVYAPQGPRTAAGRAQAVSDAFARVAGIRRMTDSLTPDDIGLALTAADVERLHAEGKQIALIGIENGYALGGELDLLDIYYDFGVRYLGLTHNGHNGLSDSAIPRPEFGDEETLHGGLSDFGRAAIKRSNELGIIVDISHTSHEATMQTVALSKAPVIASHSSIDALVPHPRNLNDEALKAIAATGGVVSIVAFDAYLSDVAPEKMTAMRAIWRDMGASMEWIGAAPEEEWTVFQARRAALDEEFPRAPVSRLIDHVEYAVNLIGVDHVGISSDFGGGGGISGWMDASETRAVTQALQDRGYSEEEIAKLVGGNMLRVMREVEAKARELTANE